MTEPNHRRRAEVIRLRVLTAVARKGEASAKDVAAEVDVVLPLIAYYLRKSAANGLIEVTRERRVRGAVQTFYRVTALAAEYTAEVRRAADEAMQECVAAVQDQLKR